jgi:DNA repair exonuclease SbcCD ATPase subunit
MKKCLIIVGVVALLAGLALLAPSNGQVSTVPVVPSGANTGFGSGMKTQPRAGSAARAEIAHLVNQLREETDEAKKAEVTKKLEAAVTKFFDEDVKVRESELTKLDERLKKLRAHLDRRNKAKTDIIQLQLKVLVNEAEGLGFSGALLDPAGEPGIIAAPRQPYPGSGPAAPYPGSKGYPGSSKDYPGSGTRKMRDPATSGWTLIPVDPSASAAAQGEIARLMHQLREVAEQAKKTELTKQLETAITKSFDDDMKSRETELAGLEDRLKKLKDQIERRRKAKADIIQLELKVLVNEAEGLGLSRSSDDGVSGRIYLPTQHGAPLTPVPGKR